MAYELCIVGAGLWGSAAARHATIKPGGNVCLVGPSEPTKTERPYRDVFSSHYDAGRTFRKYQGTNRIRSLLSMRTFKSIRELERTSGVELFKEVGHLMYGEKLRAELSPDTKEAGVFLSASQVTNRYPFLDISQYGDSAFLFPHDAGYVNPRLLVGTQQTVARQQGCDIIDDVVESVMETEIDGEQLMRVTTKCGTTLLAKKVLLCTGVFTNFKELLPPHLKLDFKIHGAFFVMFEVTESDLKQFITMPCLSSFTDASRDSYALPPIQYPDGKYYGKIGPYSGNKNVSLVTLDEVKLWFRSGKIHDTMVDTFKNILFSVVKGFRPKSVKYETCAVFVTPTTLPYCDMVSPRLGVAVGGNSFGAMTSDEMGRMAAEMIGGAEDWNLDIPKEQLQARYVSHTSNL